MFAPLPSPLFLGFRTELALILSSLGLLDVCLKHFSPFSAYLPGLSSGLPLLSPHFPGPFSVLPGTIQPLKFMGFHCGGHCILSTTDSASHTVSAYEILGSVPGCLINQSGLQHEGFISESKQNSSSAIH